MKPRYPEFDFSTFRVHWASVPEFAQRYNALSTVPAHIEPYLVKVMMKARKALSALAHSDQKQAEANKALLEKVDIFIKQENQHCKQHIAFNKMLHVSGYSGLLPLEATYKADYENFLANKSLKFNLAYSEGFEAMGSAGAENLFIDLKQFWEGADGVALDLWTWHLAEEFEHREVCYQVYRALYCRSWWQRISNGYFYRLYGFVSALAHIGKHSARCIAYLMEEDRKAMDPAQLAASIEREKALKQALGKAYKSKTLKVFSPFYDPGKKAIPPGLEAALAAIPDARG